MTQLRRAVAEALEARAYLSFDAFISALPHYTAGSNYTVHLYTTGGQASSWLINWGDGTTSAPSTAATFPTTFVQSHVYTSGNPPTAAITATATVSGSSTTASASFALSQGYGNYQFQNSGRSILTVGGDTISTDYTAVDPLTGYEYVAFAYNPGGTSHNLMAIARFDSQGDIDNSWGPNGNGIIYHQTTDSGNDTPYAIAVGAAGSPDYIVVVGHGPNGWLVEEFDDSAVGSTAGRYDFTKEGTADGLVGSNANATAVCFDTSEANHFLIVGTDSTGTKFAAASVNLDGSNPWTASPSPSTRIKTFSVGSSVVSANPTCVVEADDVEDQIVFVGGSTNYCGSVGSPSDFTIVSFDDVDASLNTSFGNFAAGVSRWNIGSCSAGPGCCTSSSSADALYSLVPWQATSGLSTVDVVTAVGTTNAFGCNVYALETFRMSDGSLYSGYGTNGVVTGPTSSGALYSAALYTTTSPTDPAHNDIVAVGSDNSGDFEAVMITPSGSVDSANFGDSSGYFHVDFGTASASTADTPYSVFVNSDGSIILGGTSGGNIALAEVLLKKKVTAS